MKDVMADIAVKYKEIKYSMVNNMADITKGMQDDVEFVDKGKINVVSERILEKIHNADNPRKRQELYYDLAFLISNDKGNISKGLKYLGETQSPLKECLLGVKAYYEGEKEEAYLHFEDNYSSVKNVERHYQINKVYGLLLVAKKKYSKAVKMLNNAVCLVPEDVELYKALLKVYSILCEQEKEKVVKDIIDLLTVQDWQDI